MRPGGSIAVVITCNLRRRSPGISSWPSPTTLSALEHDFSLVAQGKIVFDAKKDPPPVANLAPLG